MEKMTALTYKFRVPTECDKTKSFELHEQTIDVETGHRFQHSTRHKLRRNLNEK